MARSYLLRGAIKRYDQEYGEQRLIEISMR
jgi:hypothetical protein